MRFIPSQQLNYMLYVNQYIKLNSGYIVDKKIKNLQKKTKSLQKDEKSLLMADKKRDKVCDYGEKMMKKNKK